MRTPQLDKIEVKMVDAPALSLAKYQFEIMVGCTHHASLALPTRAKPVTLPQVKWSGPNANAPTTAAPVIRTLSDVHFLRSLLLSNYAGVVVPPILGETTEFMVDFL